LVALKEMTETFLQIVLSLIPRPRISKENGSLVLDLEAHLFALLEGELLGAGVGRRGRRRSPGDRDLLRPLLGRRLRRAFFRGSFQTSGASSNGGRRLARRAAFVDLPGASIVPSEWTKTK